MQQKLHQNYPDRRMSRRNFFQFGGAIIAGSSLSMRPMIDWIDGQDEPPKKIVQYRTLGRTGFKVSDIAMGGTRSTDANVVRYAYERGINYFDTGETYTRGASERAIGDAQPFMDRKKIFITTKLHLNPNETVEAIIGRLHQCLERLKTDYVDALFMHGVNQVSELDHAGYHAAIQQLKAEGRVRFAGLSCHGPRRDEGDSMEQVCLAAAEDGRFDIMLFIYNFMNREPGEKIMAACDKKKIGTTGMKTSPGILKVDPFDPENLTEQQEENLNRMMARGMTREQAIQRMQEQFKSQQESYEKTRPFIEKYGITSQEQLRLLSIQWVLQNPRMHTVCVSFADMELIDKVVPLSGTKLSEAGQRFLEDFELAYNIQYCRHGCHLCVDACPHHVPVSTIMRYAYYYACQGREKEAMVKYARLMGGEVSPCLGCEAPCVQACPYGVAVSANLMQAHALLRFA